MSGICGVWRRHGPDDLRSILNSVNSGLKSVSAERSGEAIAGEFGVAVQARFDTQQLHRHTRLLVACDTDLLNERELWKGLKRNSDEHGTAALVAALYERDGLRFAEQLRGGFAVVLCDLIERRLVAAIDGFGIKRLAYHSGDRGVMVASRADALRAGSDAVEINPGAIANVLNFSANLGVDTIFRGVRRVEPGTLVVASSEGTKTSSYWDLSYPADARASESELAARLEAEVARSVADHCADVPSQALGAFLSGGTDSSTVVGLMARITSNPVKAYSIGYREEGFNELDYATLAASAFRAEHHTYLVTAADCVEALPSIVRSFDEPFGNSSAIATYFCARMAAQHGTTTLLAGDGGDELFGGNERYATDKIFEAYHAAPTWLRQHVIEPVAALRTDLAPWRKARGYIRRANMRGVERTLSFQFLQANDPAAIFDGDFLESLRGSSVLDTPARHYAAARADAHLDRLLYVDMKITLADNDLPKVTQMSELAGIRSRFPFLDRSVAEFSARLPPRLKVKGFKKRYLFKKAFRNLLPEQIIRKRKHGFGIPVAMWMKSDPAMRELTQDTLRSQRALERGYFRRTFIEDLFRKHEQDGQIFYGDTLWVILMLELWHRHVIDEKVQLTT